MQFSSLHEYLNRKTHHHTKGLFNKQLPHFHKAGISLHLCCVCAEGDKAFLNQC